ncbi:hypothetical protein FACS1894147_05490 [Spirochaetia bacterium]|nr:hypothetical protein FACS1894147_05490 [Spirochaetia bacterium]
MAVCYPSGSLGEEVCCGGETRSFLPARSRSREPTAQGSKAVWWWGITLWGAYVVLRKVLP